MSAQIFALFANHFTQPFFDARVVDIVIIHPAFIAGIVRWINVDALYTTLILGQQGFQCFQIIPVDILDMLGDLELF